MRKITHFRFEIAAKSRDLAPPGAAGRLSLFRGRRREPSLPPDEGRTRGRVAEPLARPEWRQRARKGMDAFGSRTGRNGLCHANAFLRGKIASYEDRGQRDLPSNLARYGLRLQDFDSRGMPGLGQPLVLGGQRDTAATGELKVAGIVCRQIMRESNIENVRFEHDS